MTTMEGGQPGRGVLVVYASKMGSTREIADVVGAVLSAQGYRVTIQPADEITDIGSYDVVVLGSAVYLTQWRPEAVRFLRRHREALMSKDVWLFQSGPCGEQDAARQLPMPRNVRRLATRIGARPAVTFGGKLDPVRARGLLARWVSRGELAGDWRDWNQIRTWAATVAEQAVSRA